MADIDVQRRRPPFWPFLAGVVVLALLIWGLIRLFDREHETRIDAPGATRDTVIGAGGTR